MKNSAFLACILILAGCENSADCPEPPCGKYRYTMSASGVNYCGALGLDTYLVDGTMIPHFCHPIEEESDACGSSARFVCNMTFVTFTVDGTMEWTETGGTGEATITWEKPGEEPCTGLYTLTATKE